MGSDTEEELINAAKMNGSPVLGLVKFSQNFLIKSFCHSLNLIQSCVHVLPCNIFIVIITKAEVYCVLQWLAHSSFFCKHHNFITP